MIAPVSGRCLIRAEKAVIFYFLLTEATSAWTHTHSRTHRLLHHTFSCSLQGLKPSLAQRVIFPATAYQRHPRRHTCIKEGEKNMQKTLRKRRSLAAKKSFLRLPGCEQCQSGSNTHDTFNNTAIKTDRA